MTIIKRNEPWLGLHLNIAKCELISSIMPVQSQSLNTSAIAYLPFEFIEVLPPDASLLDALLFFGALHGAALNKKLEEYKILSSNIKFINAHDALLILKASSSSSHILFMLRCSPCLGNAIFVKLTKFLNPTLATLLMLSCLMSNGYRLVCLRRLLILWRPGKRGLGIRRAFFWLCQHILASAISTTSLQDFILIRSVAPAEKYYIPCTVQIGRQLIISHFHWMLQHANNVLGTSL